MSHKKWNNNGYNNKKEFFKMKAYGAIAIASLMVSNFALSETLSFSIGGPGGNDKTGSYTYGIEFPLIELSRDGNTCSMMNENIAVMKVYDFMSSDDHIWEFSCDENSISSVNYYNDAYFFSNTVLDMYQEWYNTKPLDQVLRITFSKAPITEGPETSAIFSDGDMIQFITTERFGTNNYFPTEINLTSHAIADLFTENNSNLSNDGEPGGIKFAFSTIAGEAAEYFLYEKVDWLFAKSAVNYEHADNIFFLPESNSEAIYHYKDMYQGITAESSSGLFRYAYYLLSNNESWSPKLAFDVFLYANQHYWGHNTSFLDGSCDVIKAAASLDLNHIDVYRAFAQVGLVCNSTELPDSDEDGISDGLESYYGFNTNDANDANLDFDGDGISNKQELLIWGTNPKLHDTDQDGLSDGKEIELNIDPLSQDSDNDSMDDAWEINHNLKPDFDDRLLDLDGDGANNVNEYRATTAPDNADARPLYPLDRLVSSFEENESKGFNRANDNSSDSTWTEHQPDGKAIAALDGRRVLFSGHDNSEEGQRSITLNFQSYDNEYLNFYALALINGDYFSVFIDDNKFIEVNNSIEEWKQFQTKLEEGFHTLKFVFHHYSGNFDHSENYGVYIDLISVGSFGDVDNNNLYDKWEEYYNLETTSTEQDSDQDQLTTLEEMRYRTNPLNEDSDGDGINDGEEVFTYYTAPTKSDTDNDGIKDGTEIKYGLNPIVDDKDLDKDSDGVQNRIELIYDANPNDADSLPIGSRSFKLNINDLESLDAIDSNKSALTFYPTTVNGDELLRSAPIPNDHSSSLKIRKLFSKGKINLLFSAENIQSGDKLIINHNEAEIDISHLKSYSLDIEYGFHDIEIGYYKDHFGSTSMDRVLLHDIEFIATDSDSDGLPDSEEIILKTDVNSADTDGDGLSDQLEVDVFNTDPRLVDTDGDGLSDWYELNVSRTDPLDKNSVEEKNNQQDTTDTSSGGSVGKLLLIFLLSMIGYRKTAKLRLNHQRVL